MFILSIRSLVFAPIILLSVELDEENEKLEVELSLGAWGALSLTAANGFPFASVVTGFALEPKESMRMARTHIQKVC